VLVRVVVHPPAWAADVPPRRVEVPGETDPAERRVGCGWRGEPKAAGRSRSEQRSGAEGPSLEGR